MRRVVIALVVIAACSSKPSVAVLDRADAPVQREAGGKGAAQPAAVGTTFYLGDVVRTSAGGAVLTLRAGGRIDMQPHTALRFVARAKSVALDIGEGSITLTGTGTYKLELGDLSLENGAVRINKDKSLELVLGRGELIEQDGDRTALEVGKVMTLELGQGSLVAVVDAAVPDAPPIAVDAAVPADRATVEVTGNGATIQAAGQRKWTKLPAGAGALEPGTRISLDEKTTARLTLPNMTLDLLPGSRATVTDKLELVIERGSATARVAAGHQGFVEVPGGRVTPLASADSGAQTTIEVGARGDTNITAVVGGAQLLGKRGTTSLDVRPGQSAVVRKAGTVAAGDVVIPDFFDFALKVGDPGSITLHDPNGTTAVQFEFAGKCSTGGALELDRDPRFRAPQISVGATSAKLVVRTGAWSYRLRCDDASRDVVASGRIIVLKDRGTRPLPRDPPRYEIATDGRTYRLDYQSRIPDVHIRAAGKGSTFKLHLMTGDNDRVLTSKTGSFAVQGTSLREREYTFWVERDGVKSKVSTLRIGFDQTAAQVYIESPQDGRSWGPHIEVSGATLPGWTAAVDGKSIPPDKNTRRFSTLVPAPREARAVAIQLAHPDRGVHVYLRRGAPRPPK